MIDLSLVDVALLSWAVIATVKAWEYHCLIRAVYRMHLAMLNDEAVYKTMANNYFEVNK